jgi:hypothetical protein
MQNERHNGNIQYKSVTHAEHNPELPRKIAERLRVFLFTAWRRKWKLKGTK